MPRLFPLGAVLLAASLFVIACSDEDDPPHYDREPSRVLVLDEVTRDPIAGVKLVPMNRETNTPAGPVRYTDKDGFAAFGDLPRGHYPVLAFGGFRYAFRGFQPEFLEVYGSKADLSVGSSPVQPGKTTPLPAPPIQFVMAYSVVPDSLPRFRGKVVDAGNGEPLDGVFLGADPFLNGYLGRTDQKDDVTGDDGLFDVSGYRVAPDPITGNLFQIDPVKVVRHGYRPINWKYDFPNGSDGVDIVGQVIELERIRPTDTGIIMGRVLRGGAPRKDVTVGVGFVDAGDKSAAGLTGWSAVTDEAGEFLIEHLPAGEYFVHAGYQLGDGHVITGWPVHVEIPVGGQITLPDIEVFGELLPVSPAAGEPLSRTPDWLAWTGLREAAEYQVVLDGVNLDRTPDSSLALPDDLQLAPGLHRWDVRAFAADGNVVGFNQVPFYFTIVE